MARFSIAHDTCKIDPFCNRKSVAVELRFIVSVHGAGFQCFKVICLINFSSFQDLVSDFASYQYKYQNDNNMNWNSTEVEREPMSYDAENRNLEYYPSQEPWAHVSDSN